MLVKNVKGFLCEKGSEPSFCLNSHFCNITRDCQIIFRWTLKRGWKISTIFVKTRSASKVWSTTSSNQQKTSAPSTESTVSNSRELQTKSRLSFCSLFYNKTIKVIKQCFDWIVSGLSAFDGIRLLRIYFKGLYFLILNALFFTLFLSKMFCN